MKTQKGIIENCVPFGHYNLIPYKVHQLIILIVTEVRSDFQFEAIGAFCKLVMYKNISPLDGIIDSAEKGWNWAKNTLHLIQDIAVSMMLGLYYLAQLYSFSTSS